MNTIKIALIGNPNSGKTTLFNALTGSNQYVGNWPGVTVEKKEGNLKGRNNVIVTDLPGIYSLSPYTPEEVVARNYLTEEKPDVILNIVDATNIERNLYLTTQVLELGIPVVIALNMMDVVEKNGDTIEIEKLSKKIRCSIIPISAIKETGLEEVTNTAISAATLTPLNPIHAFSGAVEHAIAHIEEAALSHDMPENQKRFYAIKLFERDKIAAQKLSLSDHILEHIEKDILDAESELDDDAESIITNERYVYVESILKGCYTRRRIEETTSYKIDKILTNKFLGLPIFAIIMFLVYWIAMVAVGTPASTWANEELFGHEWGVPVMIENLLNTMHVSTTGFGGAMRGLILDGIISGVGSVLGFVPQMFVLFFMLSFLESCGYMSRIAFVLDRLFRKFGLSGKSFIPILVGSGCGVPGIMASRTIENERDRKITIITTTFIPCSAKLPFIAMIAGALFHGNAWISTSAYFAGIASIIISGIILKKTKLFASDTSPFVMELPSYHLPLLKNILRSTWDRGFSFIKKAITVILISTVFVWLTSNFGFTKDGFRMLSGDELGQSLLANIGSLICWIFTPLGFGNWQMAVASITGLIAKENLVSTMGVLYADGSTSVYNVIAMNFTQISGYAFLMFNLLCAPCFAAISAIKMEMNSIKWTLFAIGYQCTFAYAVALIINQFGNALTGSCNVPGIIFASTVLLLMLFLLLRPGREPKKEAKIQLVSTCGCSCDLCSKNESCHK